MLGIKALLTLATAVTTAFARPVPSKGGPQMYKRGWAYDDELIQGVNIGGWLVLEPYITPSLFEVFGDESDTPVDEYHYTEYLGTDVATSRLQAHWSTWITEQDFQAIAGAGLNMVRIPIGYWAFKLQDGDPYIQGAEDYLDQAIGWARTYNLTVWVDLHGAPGSQNGFDNSGLRDSIEFQSGNNTDVTLEVLQYIFEKYGTSDYEDVIIGIELLNEPLGSSLDMTKLNEFWDSAYWNLRNTGSTQNVIIQDAFTDYTYFDDKYLLDTYWGVVIDHHHYQVFSQGELSRTIDEHISVACGWGGEATAQYHWNLCGEWSAALTDCAKWLNGVGRGARYDQTFTSDASDNYEYIGSCENSQDFSTWDDTKIANYRKYIEAQLDAFEQRGGWIFWCWKTEDALEWDFMKLSYNGLFPSPLSDRQYPNQCGFDSK